MLKPNSLDGSWFSEAKFGLFIHWGLYTATEGFIDGKETKGISEWIQLRERIPGEKYAQYAEKLTTDQFHAREIMELAAAAGMRYVVFTAKHHEGFSMYDTQYDDYSITGRCRSQKDPVRELTEAAREKGIVPCLYYSQGLDFHEPNAMGNTWDYETPEDQRDFDAYLNGKCKFQLRELLTNYGEIGAVWFDVPWGMNIRRAAELYSFVKSLQPRCLVNSRIGGKPEDSDYLSMGDNEIPYIRATTCAETCATTNNSWGYKRMDRRFKSPKMLIEQLCALVSKGVNFLLNVGPKPDGSVPEEAKNILLRMGRWMAVNADAVYGTNPSLFPSDFSFGWCAWKDQRIFLYIKDYRREITVIGIRNRIVRITSMSGQVIPFTHKEDLLRIKLEDIPFDDCVTVIALEVEGTPEVEQGLFQQEETDILLPACECSIHANNSEEEGSFDASIDRMLGEWWHNPNTWMKINVNGILEYWNSEQDYISWEFTVNTPGKYQVTLFTLTGKYQMWKGGHKVRLICNEQVLESTLREDVIPFGVNRYYFSEAGSHLGLVHFSRPGRYRMKLIADSINKEDPAGLSVAFLEMKKLES